MRAVVPSIVTLHPQEGFRCGSLLALDQPDRGAIPCQRGRSNDPSAVGCLGSPVDAVWAFEADFLERGMLEPLGSHTGTRRSRPELSGRWPEEKSVGPNLAWIMLISLSLPVSSERLDDKCRNTYSGDDAAWLCIEQHTTIKFIGYEPAMHWRKRTLASRQKTFSKRLWRAYFVPPIASTAAGVTVTVQFRAHVITERADNLSDTQAFKSFAQSCKFAVPARISSEAKMLPNHISIICTRPLGRIDNVALKRQALFTVE